MKISYSSMWETRLIFKHYSEESMYYIKKTKLVLDHFFYFSSDMMCVIGTDGFTKHINPSFIKLLGINQETILKTPFYEFIHPEDRKESFQRINRYMKSAEKISVKLNIDDAAEFHSDNKD